MAAKSAQGCSRLYFFCTGGTDLHLVRCNLCENKIVCLCKVFFFRRTPCNCVFVHYGLVEPIFCLRAAPQTQLKITCGQIGLLILHRYDTAPSDKSIAAKPTPL